MYYHALTHPFKNILVEILHVTIASRNYFELIKLLALKLNFY